MEFLDLDKAKLKGKTVLVRVDINSPIDPTTGEFMDVRRLYGAKETLSFLIKKGARTVVLAHQGSPGDEYEFTTLKNHAKKLSKILETEITYVDDIFGSNAKNKINSLNNGEILLLENVRFYSEEKLSRPADAHAKTHLVKELSSNADYYINDAFAAAHRSQPSLVGFSTILPSYPGKNMLKELKVLSKFQGASKGKCVFLLGGSKARDSLNVIEKALNNGSCDRVLATGLVSLVFLSAQGYDIGDKSQEFLRGKSLLREIPRAKELLHTFGDKIELPVDLALNHHGKRYEVGLSELPLPYLINDIGSQTIINYSDIIKKAGRVLANGPAGYFEDHEFSLGTHSLLTTIAASKAYTVIGGGHLAVAAESLNLRKKINHISTAGGACIMYLAGESLPVINSLRKSKELFFKGGKK